jgi:hypothetical protein
VKIVASKAAMQKPGDLPERCLQLENASRKGVQAASGNYLFGKDPVASLSLSRGRKVAGLCLFSITILLCVISVALCVSVVFVSRGKFTTETQRTTEHTQRGSPVERSPFTPSYRLCSS